jgi:hypothetical protein
MSQRRRERDSGTLAVAPESAMEENRAARV